jgi:hypothetical protein
MLNRLGKFLRTLAEAPFAMALAALGVMGGARGLFEPESSTLYIVLGVISYAWSVTYAIGGALLLYGKGTSHPKPEAAGAVLFGFGALAQAAATAMFIGESPFLTFWGVSSLVIFGVAGFLHARNVARRSNTGPTPMVVK